MKFSVKVKCSKKKIYSKINKIFNDFLNFRKRNYQN